MWLLGVLLRRTAAVLFRGFDSETAPLAGSFGVFFTSDWPRVGLCLICRHNLGNNRRLLDVNILRHVENNHRLSME